MTSERSGRAGTRARTAGLALVFFLSWFPVAGLPTFAQASEVQPRAISPAEREYRSTVAFSGKKIGLLRETAAKILGLSREPIPWSLGAAERKRIAEYDRWLQGAAGRCEDLAMK